MKKLLYQLTEEYKELGLLDRPGCRMPDKPNVVSMKLCPIITQAMDKALIPSKHAKWSPFGGSVFRRRFVLAYNPKFKKNTWGANVVKQDFF